MAAKSGSHGGGGTVRQGADVANHPRRPCRNGCRPQAWSGDGAFTQGLVERGVAQRNLTLVERNLTFARLLAKRYPDATILGIDAAELADSSRGGGRLFDAVICGRGLPGMDARQVEAIMRAAFTRRQPDASLYQFTYGWKCSVPGDVLMRLGLGAERVGTTLRNVLPASVYRLATLSGSL